MTEVRPITADSLRYAAKLINNGELVAFPTETVYGLGANAFDEKAVMRIFKAKGRPSDNPLIVHIADAEQANDIAVVSDMAKVIMKAFMPGSLTVVLPKKNCIPFAVTAGLNTVAVRNPLSEEARLFIRECGLPIAAPSANTSTRPSPTTAEAVFEDMQGKIPLILKGKDCDVGIESTVLDLTGDFPTILRPGIVTAAHIREKTGVDVGYYVQPQTGVVKSPGMKYRHYAPKCLMVLCLDENLEKVFAYIEDKKKKELNIGVICEEKFVNEFEKTYSLGLSAEDASKRLFDILRKAEKECDELVCLYTLKDEKSNGVLNRMMKASGGKVL